MKKRLLGLGLSIGFALLPAAAIAAQGEEAQVIVSKVALYAFLAFVIVVAVYVFFMRIRDKRATPLNKVFEARAKIHSVAPDTPVNECVNTMSKEKIGSLIVMDGERLVGIFTERDALNKVLAAGLDPRSTKVSAVMTRDPYHVPPATTVGAAMELVTKQRFRHLPIVENGRVLAVISSGDLTHWLVKDQIGAVQELVELTARS